MDIAASVSEVEMSHNRWERRKAQAWRVLKSGDRGKCARTSSSSGPVRANDNPLSTPSQLSNMLEPWTICDCVLVTGEEIGMAGKW